MIIGSIKAFQSGAGALTNDSADGWQSGITSTTPSGGVTGTAGVTNSMTLAEIQAVVDNVANNVIEFAPGLYQLPGTLIVRRNNVVLRGNYARLRLADNTDEPLIFVGDITSITPVNVYRNITVENFELDGNKTNQTQELSVLYPWVYNNCIGISQCENVVIAGIDAMDARSGGIVWTLNCVNLTIENCNASNNFFDGIAGYTSTAVRVINCYSHSHSNGAGLSIDNNGSQLLVQGCTFDNNDVGFFARWTNSMQVVGNNISNNSSHGLFLSGYNETPDDKSLVDCTFSGNTVNTNGGAGFYLQGVTRSVFVGNVVTDNDGNGFNVTSYGSTPSRGVSKYLNIASNTISLNGDVGFFNDASNSAGNGAVSNFLLANAVVGNTNGQVVGDVTAWTVAT